MSLSIGSQKRTTDGVIGTSGKKIRLYGLIIHSGSGGAGSAVIYNGTSTGGTEMDAVAGTTDVSVRVAYPGGLALESGCYIDIGSNTDYVTAIYEQENA